MSARLSAVDLYQWCTKSGPWTTSDPQRVVMWPMTYKRKKQQGAPWSWKVMEFRKTIFQAWKDIVKVMESNGKWWYHVVFTTALSSSVKVTQTVNHDVILLTQFALVYLLTDFLQLWSLEMVCIRKSYIVYFEISVVFFGHGKVMENQCWKRGGTPK